MAREATIPAAADQAASLLADYAAVRRYSEALAAPLTAEDQNIQSMPDASPTKWHLAHTSWFFEAVVLGEFQPDYRPFDPAYAYLFNSYYEGLGPRHPRPQRGLLSRPPLDEVLEYRLHVDEAMARLIEERTPEIFDLVTLGLHHEQQHQELILTDILHAFSCNPLLPAMHRTGAGRPRGRRPRIGSAIRRHRRDRPWRDDFAFDNETPRHRVLLRPFRIASRPVSNGEYLKFIADGGYRRPEFWLSDGWAFVQREQLNAPLYWLGERDGWRAFSLHGPMRLKSTHRSPMSASTKQRLTPPGRGRACRPNSNGRLRQQPAKPPGQVWEWTRSAYDPYPGYRPFAGEVAEYNGKFMSGQMVLRGGSIATPPGHSRPTYRNFFPPSARWQFSGIRLAGDA